MLKPKRRFRVPSIRTDSDRHRVYNPLGAHRWYSGCYCSTWLHLEGSERILGSEESSTYL